MFERIFGKSPKVKVINYLLINPERDYTKSEIAFGSEISRVTLNSMINSLKDIGFLINTGSKYKVNTESKIVQILIDTQIKLAETEIDINLKDYNENEKPLTEKEIDELLDNFDYEPDIDKKLNELDEKINNSEQDDILFTLNTPYPNKPLINYMQE